MEKNKIYITISLIIAIALASAAGWTLGKGSALNKIEEKSTGGREVSVQSVNDIFSDEKPKDIITLKVQTPISFHSGQNVIEENYGFLKKEGLKFDYVGALATPAEQLAALKSGQIDVLGGHPDIFINAVKAGIKVRAVVRGGLGHPQYPHMTFFVKEDSSIKEAKDLIGKKVAPGEGKAGAFDISCGGFYWSRYLKEQSIPQEQLIQVPMIESQQEQALRQGLIDVSANGPTFAANYIKKGGLRPLFNSWSLFNTTREKEDAEIFLVGFTEEFIKENPEAVRRYVRAFIKSSDYTNDFHEISSEYVGALQGFEPNINAEHHYSSTGLIKDSALQLWLDWYEEIGQLKPGQLKPQDLYTNEFNPFSEYKPNDPVKDPTFYDTYQLDWAKKRDASLATN